MFDIQHQASSSGSASVSEMATSVDISSSDNVNKQQPNFSLVKLFMKQKSMSTEGKFPFFIYCIRDFYISRSFLFQEQWSYIFYFFVITNIVSGRRIGLFHLHKFLINHVLLHFFV